MAIVFFVYLQLYLSRRSRYLGWWTLAWGCYLARHAAYIVVTNPHSFNLIAVTTGTLVLLGALFMLIGCFSFLGRPAPRWPLYVLPLVYLWAVVAGALHMSFMLFTLPGSLALALLYLHSAWAIWSQRDLDHVQRHVCALVLTAWALLQAAYPFQLAWVLIGKWGFLCVAALQVLTSISLLVIFFQKDSQSLIEAQAALKESEEKFAKAFRLSPAGVSITELDTGRFLEVSESFADIIGYQPRELLGRASGDLGLFADSPYDAAFEMMDAKNGSLHNREVKLRHKSGELRTVLLSSEIVGVGGRPHLISSMVDITQRERAIQELDRFFNISLDLLTIADAQGRFVRVNPACEKILGYSGLEMSGRHYLDFVHPDDQEACQERLAELLAKKAAKRFDTRFRCRDGSYKWLSWSAIHDAAERLTYAAARDVTGYREASARLEAALRDKEMLLREVHHRVKNNMQVIVSLLCLQEDSIDDRHIKQVFKESRHRVEAMALIHEALSQSGDTARVDLQSYCSALAGRLLAAYGQGRRRTELEVRGEDVEIGMDQSVACGLVLNELISNALKYAFPGGAPGKIMVEARWLDQAMVQLTVSDDGVSLPPDFDINASPTMGLMLVKGLVENQLGGELAVDRQGGARFIITFPIQKCLERVGRRFASGGPLPADR